MALRPVVPAALRTGPFKLAEAIPLGVTRGQLRGPGYCRLGAGLYRWAGLNENPQLILSAFARRLPVGAAFSGCTAAWLHGLDVAPCDPIEVTIPEPIGSSRRAGASVRRAALSGDEIALRRGLPATSALRTVVDLGGRDSLIEGVVAADLFLHAALVTIAELRTYVAGHPRAKGVARLRRVVDLAEPKAESAMGLGCGCSWCSPDFPGPRLKFPSVTSRAVSLAGQTCCIAVSGWLSNTTVEITVTGWLTTTAGRTALSGPASACSASLQRTCTEPRIELRARCSQRSPSILKAGNQPADRRSASCLEGSGSRSPL